MVLSLSSHQVCTKTKDLASWLGKSVHEPLLVRWEGLTLEFGRRV